MVAVLLSHDSGETEFSRNLSSALLLPAPLSLKKTQLSYLRVTVTVFHEMSPVPVNETITADNQRDNHETIKLSVFISYLRDNCGVLSYFLSQSLRDNLKATSNVGHHGGLRLNIRVQAGPAGSQDRPVTVITVAIWVDACRTQSGPLPGPADACDGDLSEDNAEAAVIVSLTGTGDTS
jgi:hypothetical protein